MIEAQIQALADRLYQERYAPMVRAACERSPGAGAAAWSVLRRRAYFEARDRVMALGTRLTDGDGMRF